MYFLRVLRIKVWGGISITFRPIFTSSHLQQKYNVNNSRSRICLRYEKTSAGPVFGTCFKKCLLLGLLTIQCQVNNKAVSYVDSPMIVQTTIDFYQVPRLWVLIKHKRCYLVSFSHKRQSNTNDIRQFGHRLTTVGILMQIFL